MIPVLFLWIGLTASVSDPSWQQELSFTISREFGISSDTVTLCRVRVTNHGSRTWPGREIRFVAEALDGGRVVETTHGHFGLSLAPHEALETLIGFSGRYDHFAVHPLAKASQGADQGRRKSRGGSARHPGRRKHGGRRH